MNSLGKKLTALIIALVLLLSIGSGIISFSNTSIGILTSNDPGRKGGIGNTAVLYDRSKESGATPVSTAGWDLDEVNRFHINAADPPYVDGDYIDDFLSRYYPASPMIGYGDLIKEKADEYGIAVGAFLGVSAKETTFGISSCGGQYNFGCIMWTPSSPYGKKFAADRDWIDPPTPEEGFDAWFKLVSSYVEQGLVTYKDFLDVYSPTFENDHSTFKNLMWGVIKSFGYDVDDQVRKTPTESTGGSRKEDEEKSKLLNQGWVRPKGCDFVNQSSAVGLENINIEDTNLTDLVLSWKEAVENEMARQSVDQKYLVLLLAILQVESGGGGTTDIFQSSESQGLAVNTLSEQDSIRAGVSHFKNTLNKAEDYGLSIWAVPAGYNFGHAFMDYLNREGKDWNIKTAEQYSRDVVAPSLGNTSGERLTYANEVSRSYDMPYMYRNGGNFHYVPMIMQALGYDLQEIKNMALNGASGGAVRSGSSSSNPDKVKESFTYFGDSLVAGTEHLFREKFTTNPSTFGRPSMQFEHSNGDLDGISQVQSFQSEIRDNIVVQLGTNAGGSIETIERFVKAIGNVNDIYLVTTASNVSHASSVNANIKAVADKHNNVHVIDWASHVGTDKDKYYQADGIHFNDEGAQAIIDFIYQEVQKNSNKKVECFRIPYAMYRLDQKQNSVANGDIVEMALSIDGYWTYSQPNRTSVLAHMDPPDRNDQTDCSGFVYWVLKATGHKVMPDMWWTGAMQDDINGPQEYLQKLEASETEAGDIIIQHYAHDIYMAHTAILLEPWNGPNTKIIQVGGSGSGVNQSTAGMSGLGNPTSFGRAIKDDGN